MPTTKKRTKESPEEQRARFIDTARKLGADERPEEFDKQLKKVIKKPSGPSLPKR